MHTVRQPVMAGLGGPEGPGTPYTQARPRQQRVETPLPSVPLHWGRLGRLHHCWHPNEKVNIEPKDLGGGSRAAGSTQRGSSCLGPAWLPQGLPQGRDTLNHRGRDRLGNRPGDTVGSARCTHRQRGAFRACSVLRLTPLSPLSCSTWPGVSPDPGPTHSFTEASRPPQGSSSASAFTFSMVKMSFLRTRKKKIKMKRRQHNRAAFTEKG